jgi:hypothetical protein
VACLEILPTQNALNLTMKTNMPPEPTLKIKQNSKNKIKILKANQIII